MLVLTTESLKLVHTRKLEVHVVWFLVGLREEKSGGEHVHVM